MRDIAKVTASLAELARDWRATTRRALGLLVTTAAASCSRSARSALRREFGRDAPASATHLRIEERKLDAGGLNW